jgi:hypothetical protein
VLPGGSPPGPVGWRVSSPNELLGPVNLGSESWIVKNFAMGAGRRWRLLMCLSVAAATGLSACSGGGPVSKASPSSSSGQSSATSAGADGKCVLNDLAVPSCGVLWGVATKPPTAAAVATVESAQGRPFDFVYRYHDVKDQVPDDAERAAVAAGKLLHLAIASRDFNSTRGIKWSEFASGKFDPVLIAQAKGVASLKVPVFMTFEQEASQRQKVGVRGTPEEFIRAWKHLHQIYDDAGAKNAVWVWVMTGSEDNLDNAASLWPGNDVVDWISWNVYNQSGCSGNRIDASKYVSFEDKMKIFYEFVKKRGPSLQMDPNKPMMISETGSAKYPNDLKRTADWYAGIPATLRKYPQIKAVTVWDSIDGGCNYDIDKIPEIRDGVRRAGQDPWLSNRGAVGQPR